MKYFTLAGPLLVFLFIKGSSGGDTKLFAECTDSNQCEKSQCCVLSMERYARPMCVEMRIVGDMCNPYSEPKSSMVAKPHPTSGYLNLTNVYETLCPCALGLTCSKETSQCEEKPTKIKRKLIKKLRRT